MNSAPSSVFFAKSQHPWLTRRVLVTVPNMMHLPVEAPTEDMATCEVIIWVHGNQGLVLFVDLGGGASVTNAADVLIAYLIREVLPKIGIGWKQYRWFEQDSQGKYDEIRVVAFKGGNEADVAWDVRPPANRTLEGFLAVCKAEIPGFDSEDRALIRVANERRLRKASRHVQERSVA